MRSEPDNGSGQLSARPAIASDDIVFSERDMHEVPHDVIEGDVGLLDTMDAERWDDERMAGKSGQPPAVLAREGDRHQPEVPCHLERMDEVGRLAARTERERHVAA